MLLQLLAAQPQMLGTVVANTPRLIRGLLASLIVLGLSQRQDRDVSLRRVLVTPPVSALSGAFSGIFAGRAARLLRLALRLVAATPSITASVQRNSWSGGTQ